MRARTAALLGLALIGGGALFGTPSLYPAGVVLVALPAVAFAWVQLAGVGLGVTRRLPEGSPTEGAPLTLELGISPGLLPPPGGAFTDPLLPQPRPLSGSEANWRGEVSFARRGRRALGRAEVVIRDPFGLAELRRSSRDGGELVVLPRTEPLEMIAAGAGVGSLGPGERGAAGSGPDSWAAEFEIDGLRPYREGSPASRIHWPTVARTGELHERRITAGADAARLVVLDPIRPAGEEELDAAVRAAASICLELAASGGCTLLIGGDQRTIELDPRLRSWPVAHHRLALVEPDAGPPAVHRINRAGVSYWVGADPGRGIERRAARLQTGRTVLVRPSSQAARGPVSFRVAGCEASDLRPPRQRSRVAEAAA